MYPPIIDSTVRFLPLGLWWLVFIDGDIALGFLGGKEAQAAGIGNAGLRDRACLACHSMIPICWSAKERFALKWIQKHIAAFGGDPERVTMYASSTCSGVWCSSWTSFLLYSWGESAGAASVGYHLVINDGNSEGLFHGAFMVRLLFESLFLNLEKRFFPHSNPVSPGLCKTSLLNNPCSTNSLLTPNALDLLTLSLACEQFRSIL